MEHSSEVIHLNEYLYPEGSSLIICGKAGSGHTFIHYDAEESNE